jgi:hypothetical protein
MAVLQFNDKAARALERVYSSVDVVAQREATLERLALRSGEKRHCALMAVLLGSLHGRAILTGGQVDSKGAREDPTRRENNLVRRTKNGSVEPFPVGGGLRKMIVVAEPGRWRCSISRRKRANSLPH